MRKPLLPSVIYKNLLSQICQLHGMRLGFSKIKKLVAIWANILYVYIALLTKAFYTISFAQ